MLPLIVLLSTSCVYRIVHEQRPLDVNADFDSVLLRVDAGDIHLLGQPDFVGASGMADMEWHGTAPEITLTVQGDTLIVDVDCHSSVTPCSADISLTVPDEVDVWAETGAGEVSARDLRGTLDLETGAGDLDFVGTVGTVFAQSGAGDVFGSGIASPVVEVDTGAGRIDLTHTARFERLVVETGAGDIDLLVPAGAYAVDADSGTGGITILGITQDDHADASIQASTGAGAIMITGYQPGTES